MYADSQVKRTDAPSAVGSDALTEGLMLVRASTLKVIRLQLAMERRDRRVVLKAVDELVALDRRLQDYLAHVPAPELDDERAALNREKLTLAAEVIRVEPKPPPEPVAAQPVREDFSFEEKSHSRRALWWVAALLTLVSLAAAVAYWIAGPPFPAMFGAMA